MISTRISRLASAVVFCLAGSITVAFTPVGPSDFSMDWRTIDGGGGVSSGGDLSLAGTIAQPDAGPLAAGDLMLLGGFMPGGGAESPPCFGDIDGSGDVGFGDLLMMLSAWGTCAGCPADLDGSGDVGFSDLLQLLSAWGPCV